MARKKLLPSSYQKIKQPNSKFNTKICNDLDIEYREYFFLNLAYKIRNNKKPLDLAATKAKISV